MRVRFLPWPDPATPTQAPQRRGFFTRIYPVDRGSLWLPGVWGIGRRGESGLSGVARNSPHSEVAVKRYYGGAVSGIQGRFL